MKKYLFILSGFLFSLWAGSPAEVRAQQHESTDWAAQEQSERYIRRMDSLLEQMASFEVLYPTKADTLRMNKYGYAPYEVPRATPETVRKRLADMQPIVAMDYNQHVQLYINVYTVHKRKLTSEMLGLQSIYFPMIEEIFVREGVPLELKYVACIESALNPYAMSYMQALGLWQFMYGTGKMYGLRIDNYVDERRDPYKSTVAAARYFKDLYNIFKDWHLVMAAYNAGPGTVSRAIKRSGGITNFWKLSPYLPRATAGYVPAFIGCAYAMQYATEHNMYPITPVFPYSQDTIQLVNQRVTLDQIAAATGADLGILRKLNPELKTTVVPFSSRPYVLRVPSAVVWKAHELGYRFGGQPESGEPNLAVNQSQPISFAGAQPETPRPEVSSGLIPTARAATPRPAVPAVPYGTKLVWHEVSAGETVSRIAVYYQVTEQQIRQWNGLTAVHLQVGQKLKVFCPANLDVAKAVRRPGQEVPSAPAASQNAPAQARVHRVRYGDTLWTIAQQYKGISLEDLMKLNGLNKNSILHVGQVIRIPG